MFSSDIILTGKHAEILKKYATDKQGELQYEFIVLDNESIKKKIHLFDTMIQEYMCAAMLGIIEKKSVPADRSSSASATMFASVVIKNQNYLKRIVQFMLLSIEDVETDQKIKDAFSINKNENYIQDQLNSFARGGLEIIDGYFNDCKTCLDVACKIKDIINIYSMEPESKDELGYE